MVVLVLVLCMEANQAQCTEHRPVLEPMPMMACMRQGMLVGAAYLRDWPGWRSAKYRCEPYRMTL